MNGAFNKTFLKFLVRFALIIFLSITGVFIAGVVDKLGDDSVTARVQGQ